MKVGRRGAQAAASEAKTGGPRPTPLQSQLAMANRNLLYRSGAGRAKRRPGASPERSERGLGRKPTAETRWCRTVLPAPPVGYVCGTFLEGAPNRLFAHLENCSHYGISRIRRRSH